MEDQSPLFKGLVDDSMTSSYSDVTDLSTITFSESPPSSSKATSNVASEKGGSFSVRFAVQHDLTTCSEDGSLAIQHAIQIAWLLTLHQFLNKANDTVDIAETPDPAIDAPLNVSLTLRLPSELDFEETPQDLWSVLFSGASSIDRRSQKIVPESSLIRFLPSKLSSRDITNVMDVAADRAEDSGVSLPPSFL